MITSIIFVNYKSTALLLDALHSIYSFPTNDLEIIVVDNGSEDSVESILKNKYPEIQFIQMGYNAGFARANNAGIRTSKGELVLLLNTDTIILDDAINQSALYMRSSDAVACGVQLLNTDYTPQISGNFAMKGGLNYLLPLPYLGPLLKKISVIFNVNKPNIPLAKGTVFVDWINGAFLMVKREIIEMAGLLDEDFFLYAEEAEWCSRIKKFGKLSILGDLHVIHCQGATSNVAFESKGQGYYYLSDNKGFQIMLSNFVRIRKEFGVLWFFIMLFLYMVDIPVFLLGMFIEKLIFLKQPRHHFFNWIGFSKNVFRLISFSYRILLNKPYFYKVL